MLPDLANIHAALANEDTRRLPLLQLAVLRNITVEPMEPYWRYLALGMHMGLGLHFGEFNAVYQECVGGRADLLNNKTDAVLVFFFLGSASPALAKRFAALSPAAVAEEITRLKQELTAMIQGVRSQTTAMILWHGFERPLCPGLGICDVQSPFGQTAAVQELNDHLRTSLAAVPNAYLVDTGLCLARVGAKAFYDLRYWHIGRAPYGAEGLAAIAFEDFKYIRPLKGKAKKCLVLDCDNTLWGGIVGEDGVKGIRLGKTNPGSAYRDFQQEALNLYHRGVILALCSKNNEQDVREVFSHHPDMVLREEHVAASRINWSDKVSNLREIAQDLNVGLDSLVFMDDSPFEIDLIRSELPEVEAILLPANAPAQYAGILASCGLFETLTLSEEDRRRGAMYRAEATRRQCQAQAVDMESYYRGLEMELDIRLADAFAIPRIAQQTQKTNQFNLTTRRYSDANITRFVESPDHDVFFLRLKDRYGDYGIVGACILRYEDDTVHFDTFLLSCRVLGRGVERAFLAAALQRAAARDCRLALGEYYATGKNAQVETFYGDSGFQELQAEDLPADRTYVRELGVAPLLAPGFFRSATAFGVAMPLEAPGPHVPAQGA